MNVWFKCFFAWCMLSSSFSDPKNLLSDICTKVNVFIIQSPVSSKISYHIFLAIVNLAFKNSGYSFVVKDDRECVRVSCVGEWYVLTRHHSIRVFLNNQIIKHTDSKFSQFLKSVYRLGDLVSNSNYIIFVMLKILYKLIRIYQIVKYFMLLFCIINKNNVFSYVDSIPRLVN
jgi:hypothetical protein